MKEPPNCCDIHVCHYSKKVSLVIGHLPLEDVSIFFLLLNKSTLIS